MSVEQSGTALRLVCAEIRALFVESAAATLSIDASDIELDDGKFVSLRSTSTPATGATYWSLLHGINLDRDASGSVQPKRPHEWRVIGTSAGDSTCLPRLRASRALFTT
jgi:hypothetical protein